MLVNIIKGSVYVFIAGLLLISLVQFFKKTRHLTKSETKKAVRGFKLFQVGNFFLAMLIVAVYVGGLFIQNAHTSSAIVSLNYAEASLGQNANGTRYNISEIICSEVLKRVIEKGGFEDISAGDLKKCLSVRPVVEGNAFAKDSYHISTEFVVSYHANSKTSRYSSRNIMQLLCNSYRDYYFDKYVNNFEVKIADINEVSKNLDYLDMQRYLTKEANQIQNFLYYLQTKSSSFISSDGSTFASEAAKLNNLLTTQIDSSYYSFVLQNGLSKNSSALINRLDVVNKDLYFDRITNKNSYDITNSAIAVYDKDMATAVLVPTWDNNGKYYMGRTKVGIDELSVQAVDYSNKLGDVLKKIDNNRLQVSKFSQNGGNTEQNRQKADELISRIYSDIVKFAKETRSITQSYNENRMNQCISANVSVPTIMTQFKTIAILLAVVYVALVLYYNTKKMSLNDEIGG